MSEVPLYTSHPKPQKLDDPGCGAFRQQERCPSRRRLAPPWASSARSFPEIGSQILVFTVLYVPDFLDNSKLVAPCGASRRELGVGVRVQPGAIFCLSTAGTSVGFVRKVSLFLLLCSRYRF